MKKFEVTVQNSKYEQEMQVGVRVVTPSHMDDMDRIRWYNSSEDKPDTVYLARVATAVMSRFCAYIFPKYGITIELGKPLDAYYSYNQTLTHEMRIIIKGYMDKIEQDRMLEMLNIIVAESQREAMG